MMTPKGTIERFTRIFGLERAERLPHQPPGTAYWRGGTIRDAYLIAPPEGFELRDAPLSDSPYRNTYVSESEQAILCYCEGDLSIEIIPAPFAFQFYIRDLERFYRIGEPMPTYEEARVG